MLQRRADVERESVAGDPAGDAHADGADLLGADPRASQPGDAAGGQPVVGADANHHFFDVANVAVHVAAIRLEVENRIADHLAGAVISDVATAAGLVNGDPEFVQTCGGGKDVRASAVTFDSEGDDRGMLQQHQHVADRPGAPLLDEVALQREPVGIRHHPEPTNFQRALRDCHLFENWGRA